MTDLLPDQMTALERRLTAQLAQARAESFELLEQHAKVRNDIIIELETERDQMRAVVEAARELFNGIGTISGTIDFVAQLQFLRQSLDALDQARAPDQTQVDK